MAYPASYSVTPLRGVRVSASRSSPLGLSVFVSLDVALSGLQRLAEASPFYRIQDSNLARFCRYPGARRDDEKPGPSYGGSGERRDVSSISVVDPYLPYPIAERSGKTGWIILGSLQAGTVVLSTLTEVLDRSYC